MRNIVQWAKRTIGWSAVTDMFIKFFSKRLQVLDAGTLHFLPYHCSFLEMPRGHPEGKTPSWKHLTAPHLFLASEIAMSFLAWCSVSTLQPGRNSTAFADGLQSFCGINSHLHPCSSCSPFHFFPHPLGCSSWSWHKYLFFFSTASPVPPSFIASHTPHSQPYLSCHHKSFHLFQIPPPSNSEVTSFLS